MRRLASAAASRQRDTHRQWQQQQQHLKSFFSCTQRTFSSSAKATVTSINGDDFDYDLCVIGAGSGGVACADEATALGARVCILDKPNSVQIDHNNGSNHLKRVRPGGIGGTCVNVGCIPKKLFVQAAAVGEKAEIAPSFGWRLAKRYGSLDKAETTIDNEADSDSALPALRNSWRSLSLAVQRHIRSLNFGTQSRLLETGVEFYPALGTLVPKNNAENSNGNGHPRKDSVGHRIRLDYGAVEAPAMLDFDFGLDLGLGGNSLNLSEETEKKKKKTPGSQPDEITARHVVLAVGGEPSISRALLSNGAELCITSDDLFWSSDLFAEAEKEGRSGNAIVVGGGYIALECAGFLRGLGHNVTVLNRSSVFLRGFDTGASALVVEDLRARGVSIMPFTEIETVQLDLNGTTRLVSVRQGDHSDVQHLRAEVVLVATGRTVAHHVRAVGAFDAGLALDTRTGKVVVNSDNHALSMHSSDPLTDVHAIGDCAFPASAGHGLELTPVAIKQGRALAHRLFGRTASKWLPRINPELVPSSVFTPLEYSFCGLSEEAAREQHGVAAVDIFHAFFHPLENALLPTDAFKSRSYVKIVVRLPSDPSSSLSEGAMLNGVRMDAEVVGLHLLGPHAGETIQGLAAGLSAVRTHGACFTVSDLWSSCGIHPTNGEEVLRWGMVSGSSGIDPEKTSC